MQIRIHETMQLGDLIVAAYDEAARQTSEPRDVSRVATRVVRHFLRGAQRALVPRDPPSHSSGKRSSGQGDKQ